MKGSSAHAGDWLGRWKGRTVVVLASGPSLTPAQIERVRAAAHPTIVTNSTFLDAPWAEVLIGFDARWWRVYGERAAAEFSGTRLGCSAGVRTHGAVSLYQQSWFHNFGNSGTAAVSLAVIGEAQKVVLLGVDCQRVNGRIHHHGDHPKGLGNALSLATWPRKFKQAARFARERGVEVVNCSPGTALTHFPTGALEAHL